MSDCFQARGFGRRAEATAFRTGSYLPSGQDEPVQRLDQDLLMHLIDHLDRARTHAAAYGDRRHPADARKASEENRELAIVD
ncbi:hypothetical protein [Candidatus Nitrospira bockiana]